MARALRLALVAAAAAVSGCQLDPGDAGYPPLPGPSRTLEVVAVSTEIASSDRPVFYTRDGQDPKRLLAYDWTGAPRGSLTLSATEPFGVYPSADGTAVLLQQAKVLTGGRSLGKVALGTWAGDNLHLCTFLNRLGGPGAPRTRQISANEMTGIDTPGTLFYESASGGTRRVVDYASFGPHGGPAVLACSAKNDRAVIGGSFVANMGGLTMIRLPDGHVITPRLGGAHRGADGVLVSSDAGLLAMGSTGGITMGARDDAFTVFRVPGNEIVAQVSGGGIEAFSADNSRVLIVENVGASNERRRYQLIDLATSQSLWSAVLSPGTVLTRPGSGDFLVGSRTYEPSLTRTNGNDAFEDLWLVSKDGAARLLLKHVAPLS